jgi:hypothetical protein
MLAFTSTMRVSIAFNCTMYVSKGRSKPDVWTRASRSPGCQLAEVWWKARNHSLSLSPNADQARPISIHSAHRGTLPHVAFEIQDTFVLRLRTQRDQTRPHKTIKTATKEICGDSLTGSDVLVSRLGNTAQDVRSSLFPKWPCGKPGE